MKDNQSNLFLKMLSDEVLLKDLLVEKHFEFLNVSEQLMVLNELETNPTIKRPIYDTFVENNKFYY